MSRLTFKSLTTALVLFLLFGMPSIASADGVTWNLNLNFDDGGTAKGSFNFDPATTNLYSAISIVTTAGTTLPGSTYSSLSFLATPTDTGVVFGASSGDLTGTGLLFLLFDGSLTDFSKPIDVSILSPSNSIEGLCGDPSCFDFSFRSVVAGGQIVPIPPTATPEPPVISLLGMGLIVLLMSAAIAKMLHA